MKAYKPDFEALDRLAKEGFVRKVISPCKRLVLYNYTDKCTYEKKWNEHTINARGTVYEIATGKVVARAFPKFFNFGELVVSKQRNLLKKESFTTTEKMDGSLGIMYFYDGEWRINTRGSFTSDQAVKAKGILHSKYDINFIDGNDTILLEIIYPSDKIVVDYGDKEELVILSVLKTSNAEERNPFTLNYISSFSRIPVVNKHHFSSIQEIVDKIKTMGMNEEGFVVQFDGGERVKFKSEEYLKVARLLSNLTPLNFWRNMSQGKVDENFISIIPEEFRKEVDEIKNSLENEYVKIQDEIVSDIDKIIRTTGRIQDQSDFKKVGLALKDGNLGIKHDKIIFPYISGKDIDSYIMKYIRPVGNVLE